MNNNVIYGAFGQRSATSAVPQNSSIAIAENTVVTMSNRLQAQHKVLQDLAELVNDPELPKEIGDPLRVDLDKLQTTAQSLATKLVRAQTNDLEFLQIQTELNDFGKALIDFEADVLHKTGAEIEVIEAPVPATPAAPLIQQTSKWVNSPKFWIGLSVGVSALAGLVWWGLHANKAEPEEPPVRKMEKVKLRRALPAR